MMSLEWTSFDNNLVDVVYDSVIDPTRYDALIDAWQEKVGSEIDRSDDTYSLLMAHFERANKMISRLTALPPEGDLAHYLDAKPVPAIIFSRRLKIVSFNRLAEKQHHAKVGLDLSCIGLSADTQAKVASLIKEGLKENSSKVFCVFHAKTHKPFLVSLLAITSPAKYTLVRTSSIVWPESLDSLFRTLFDLTQAECRVVKNLVDGFNLNEIAEQRNVSLTTVRTQLRNIFSKTATHSQPELLRMAIGFVQIGENENDVITAEARDNSANNYSGPGRISQFAHRDDVFDTVTIGDTKAEPVLVMHDEIIANTFLFPLLRLAGSKQFSFHMMLRHGYGNSCAHFKNPEELLIQYTAALAKYLQSISDNEPVRIICQGNGFYFASHLAQKHPDLVKSIVAISPSLPFKEESDFAGMPRYNHFISSVKALSPAMLEFGVRVGFSLCNKLGEERFIQKLYSNLSTDSELLEVPAVMADLRHGETMTRCQGHIGFLMDEKIIVQNWTEQIQAVDSPIDILIGEHDQISRLTN